MSTKNNYLPIRFITRTINDSDIFYNLFQEESRTTILIRDKILIGHLYNNYYGLFIRNKNYLYEISYERHDCAYCNDINKICGDACPNKDINDIQRIIEPLLYKYLKLKWKGESIYENSSAKRLKTRTWRGLDISQKLKNFLRKIS